MKLLSINLPQYTIDYEPDINLISSKIDDVIKHEFGGKYIVVRGIASSEHPNKTTQELVDIVSQTGTDRYNPERIGDRYENIDNKHIDLFGVLAEVSDESEIAQVIIWGFYHSAIAIHGKPMKIDVISIYDAHQLEQIHHQYEGRDDVKNDGFVFKQPDRKADALLGIIQIN